jgi:hypothetical protein
MTVMILSATSSRQRSLVACILEVSQSPFLTLQIAAVFVIEVEFRGATFSGKPKTKVQ